jgi:hypothetical protein
MLVKTGRPLPISNPDLSQFNQVEFFRLFPDLQSHFRLATAVQLNATFPGISPPVALPTQPSVRAVDAGYYDNYGVDIANRFLLQQHMSD